MTTYTISGPDPVEKTFSPAIKPITEREDEAASSLLIESLQSSSTDCVADSSAQAWQNYCDAPLRQFGSWR